jgi:hypothetical protein
MCDLPNDMSCDNWRFCRAQMAAWEIPYLLTEEGLFVKFSGSYYFSHREYIQSNFSYPEINKIIRDAWYEVGWAAAESCDSLPF